MNVEKTVKNNTDAYYFHEGTATRAYEYLGAHKLSENEGMYRYAFRTFAHRANSVELAGDFNSWGGAPLTRISESGIFELIYESEIPLEGMRYKYRIFSDDSVELKADPFAQYSEWGTHTASIIWNAADFEWHDRKWLASRKALFEKKSGFYPSPMNIYEIHLESWRTRNGKCTSSIDAYLNYRELAHELSKYIKAMGYTHVQILPIMEYSGNSFIGEGTTGYFAPTSRFGNPDDFRFFVDKMHSFGIGVILELPILRFGSEAYGLQNFDGHRMYEYRDAGKDAHAFDLGRAEVRSFIISNSLFWLREYHVDGLYFGDISDALYPQSFGYTDNTEENADAADFFKLLNKAVFFEFPDALMIAGESSGRPLVTAPVDVGGLGFNFKLNKGWTADVMDYISTDPYVRENKHVELTFSLRYAFGENYILPITYKEVTGGQKALLDKMFGGYDDKFAGMRAFLGYMICHPGKKLSFMGSEFGQFREWDPRNQLDWFLSDFEAHEKLQNYVKRLNRFYSASEALWERDFSSDGFLWLYEGGAENNIVAFKRIGKRTELVCIMNFSVSCFENFELFVGKDCPFFIEMINSDSEEFGGKGRENRGLIDSSDGHLKLFLPPLSALILQPFDNDRMNDKEAVISVKNNFL